MAVYRFRVTYEDHEDTYRDIEIKATQTFEDLHNAIQEAIGFDNTKPASFYISDDYWRKGSEIALRKNADDDQAKQPKMMNKSKIAAFIEDPHQKFLYITDFSVNWTFWVELTKIILEDSKGPLPKCVKTSGTMPKQYKQVNLPPPADDEDEPAEKTKEAIFTSEESFEPVEENSVLLDEEDEVIGDVEDPTAVDDGAEPAEED